jgi:hypothetical protein
VRADDIRIPEPCHEDWARMRPEERGWHCKLCVKHVHDLTSMTEKQVKALLASGQDICVAYDVDRRGDIVFAPEPVVPIARLVRRPVAAAAAGLALALAACTPHGDEHDPRVDAPDHPTQVQSSPVIPERAPEPAPIVHVEPEPIVDEPCDTPEPAIETPPIRHIRGEVAPVRPPMLKGRPVFNPSK